MTTTRRKVAATNANQPKTESDAIRAFVQELKALTRARQQAERKIAACEEQLAEARHKLAECEASRLIEDPDAESVNDSPESREFVTASLALEQARAALGGLRRRITERDVEILTVAEKLKAQRQEFNQAAVERFLVEQFRPAAERFAAVLRLGHALSAALGMEISEVHRLPDCGEWSEDQEAVRLHDQHAVLRNLANELEGFQRDATVRTVIAEKNRRLRADFDPSGTYKVIRPFQCYGLPYAVGQTVNAHNLDSRLLGSLYASKHLELIQAKEEWEA